MTLFHLLFLFASSGKSTANSGYTAANSGYGAAISDLNESLLGPQWLNILQNSAPPIAPAKEHTIHNALGPVREDPYYWLRAKTWNLSPHDEKFDEFTPEGAIASYIEEENAYWTAASANHKNSTELWDEVRDLVNIPSGGILAIHGPYTYEFEYEEGAPLYPLYYRRNVKSNDRKLILNMRELCGVSKEELQAAVMELEEPDCIATSWPQHSGSHQYFALTYKKNNEGFIRVYDMDAGVLVEELPNPSNNGAFFTVENDALMYVTLDSQNKSSSVNFHMIGGDLKNDTMVYQYGKQTEPGYLTTAVYLTSDRKYLTVFSIGSTPEKPRQILDHRLLKASYRHSEEIEIMDKGIVDAVTPMTDHHGRDIFLLSNKGNALGGQIWRAKSRNPTDWELLVKERAGHVILSMFVTESHVVWNEVFDGRIRACTRSLTGTEIVEIDVPLPAPRSVHALGLKNLDTKLGLIQLAVTSPGHPTIYYEYNLLSGDLTENGREIKDWNSDDYITERLDVPIQGGKIPLTVFRHKDTPIDGTAPVLLEGYGAYGIPFIQPFKVWNLPFVQRGGIVVEAHLRGGSDLGYKWYKPGARLDTKTNTFTDVIAVAEFLIQEGYCQKKNIVVSGASAGGLMVGAAVNMRPDLWAGAVATVPFLDAVSTMEDPSLPLTVGEFGEWGNPSRSMEEYNWIASYSPYDNIQKAQYPPMFLIGGLTDSQVGYWEPLKMLAKLRANTNGGPFFGLIGPHGHTDPDPMRTLSFILRCANIDQVKPHGFAHSGKKLLSLRLPKVAKRDRGFVKRETFLYL